MHCSDFLELYSDYRDGLLTDPATVRRVHRHLRVCSRCMNYDALVSRGVMTLRSISEIKPASKFEPALIQNRRPIGSQRQRMPRAVPLAALLGALVTASAMLVLQDRAGAVDPAVPSATAVEPVAPPTPALATGIVQLPDSMVPFVRNDARSRLITFTDLETPDGSTSVESFATWVTLSR